MRCPYCGETSLKPGVETCPKCGVVIGVRNPYRRVGGWIASIVGLVGCLIVVWGYFLKFGTAFSLNTPDPAHDTVVQAGYACIGGGVVLWLYFFGVGILMRLYFLVRSALR